MKTIVVLGATGHLGCYSALALARQGYRVVAVGRREEVGVNNFFSRHGMEYVGGVVLERDGWWDKLCHLKCVDAVVHLAGTMPAHSGLAPMPYVQGIVVAMVNVCEWMRSIGCSRIIFNTTPSDVSAMFGGQEPIPDDAPRSFPKSGNDHAVYAICKNAAVDLLGYYQIKYGFKPCVFRHFMVYGWHSTAVYHLDGQPRILPYRQMIRKCLAGETLTIWGDPSVKRDILYIEDFAQAVVTAVGNDACGLFNLAGDRKYTLEEQVRTIQEVFSSKSGPLAYDKTKPSAPQLLLTHEKAERELGWRAKWSWKAACEDMKRYYIHNEFEELWGPADREDCLTEGVIG